MKLVTLVLFLMSATAFAKNIVCTEHPQDANVIAKGYKYNILLTDIGNSAYEYSGDVFFGTASRMPPQFIDTGVAYLTNDQAAIGITSEKKAPYSQMPEFSIRISKQKNSNNTYTAYAIHHSFGSADQLLLQCK